MCLALDYPWRLLGNGPKVIWIDTVQAGNESKENFFTLLTACKQGFLFSLNSMKMND